MKELVYGPVRSWRFGRSLGINLLGKVPRICTFSCIYCELGKEGVYERKRRVFVPTDAVLDEFKKHKMDEFDVITFSGAGEPTLAKNIGEVSERIRRLKKDKPQILLTNSTLLSRDDVLKDIVNFDIIDCKLDGTRDETIKKINRPLEGITVSSIINGIKRLREKFSGILSIQIMVIDLNFEEIEDLAEVVKEIKPNEVHLNTPTREPWKKPIPTEKLLPLKRFFHPLKVRTPYDYTNL